MPRKQKKYHYIYKTTNIITGKYYIGMHSTNDLNDGYIGSGKRLWYLINKYGKENHKFEILEFFSDRKSLRKRESELVNEELLQDPMCMNLTLGGGSGFDYLNSDKFNNPTHTKEFLNEIRKKALEALNDPIKFKNRNKKISKKLKKAYADGKRQVLCKPHIKGKYKHSKEIRQKISKAKKGKCSDKNNSQYGTKWAWINKNQKILKICRNDLNIFIEQGWKRGTKQKIKHKCKKCGEEKCKRPNVCKSKIIDTLILKFGFKKESIGNLSFYEEYDRIYQLLYDEYHINRKSLREIGKKYNINPPHKIHSIFKSLNIECRSKKDALDLHNKTKL